MKEEMQTFLHFECVHTYSVFWDTIHINNGQNEALGHCLRDIMSMRHNTLPEYEACLPSFPYFKFYRGSCRSFHTFQLSCKVKCRKNYKKRHPGKTWRKLTSSQVSKFLSNILQMWRVITFFYYILIFCFESSKPGRGNCNYDCNSYEMRKNCASRSLCITNIGRCTTSLNVKVLLLCYWHRNGINM